MSRAYEMSVTITGCRPSAEEAIKEAAQKEWCFSAWLRTSNGLYGCGRSSLCGGEGEEEFVDRLAVAIWKANGAYCEVLVDAAYLEEIPCEEHIRTEDDYERLMRQAEKSASDSSEVPNGQ